MTNKNDDYSIYPFSADEASALDAVLEMMKGAKTKVHLWKAGDNGSLLGVTVVLAKASKIGGGEAHASLSIRFADDNTREENRNLLAKFGVTEDMIPTRKTNA